MFREALARRLEAGGRPANVGALAARVWSSVAASRIARPLRVPPDVSLVAVGGATLGGSWKTPVALASAKCLARAGVPVTLVGHAYRAHPRRARFVRPDDDVRIVGDEALACAQDLDGIQGARVVVAPSRQEALEFASTHSNRVVIDGPLQITPRRARLSLLAVDEGAPWGAAFCPPCGDLRAPVSALVAACDRVVAVRPSTLPSTLGARWRVFSEGRASFARAVMRGVRFEGALLGFDALATLRVGLFCAVARPSRLLAALAAAGVSPALVVTTGDHGPLRPRHESRARVGAVDLWICTAKCRTHLGAELGGRPIGTVEVAVEFDEELGRLLVGLGRGDA